MNEDPTIGRIREARHEISEENEHDPVKLVEYYRELQKQHSQRMATPPPPQEPGKE
jgi:hypothetical protein